MESFFLYLLKSASLLSMFHVAYILLLKNDTSFEANRKFLLGGIAAAIVLPSIYFTKTVILKPIVQSSGSATIGESIITNQFSGWQILGAIYLLVTGILIIRSLIQIFGIIRLIKANKIKRALNYNLINTKEQSGPFSFFSYIFYNSELHTESELKTILIHEKVHVDQGHSIDILCANLITAILWFNPLSWYYKISIEQNLEYLADKETAIATNNVKSYQHTLLKVSLGNHSSALVNHFHQSFIKKRIVMLNNKSSHPMSSIKMLLVAPFIFAFMLSFNVKTIAQVKQDQSQSEYLTELIQDKGTTFVIKADFTTADLESLKKEMKSSDLTLMVKDLQRNDEGLISNLNVKVKGRKNYFVSGSYSDEAGIADLYFGYTETGGMKIYNLESE